MTPFEYSCVFRGNYDGDTLTIDIDQGFNDWKVNQKIRLFGVDTPELRGAERERGLMVRDKVASWCQVGRRGEIRTFKDKAGKYGRWLGLIVPDGWTESINARLLREGMAEIEAYSDRERAEVEALLR